MWCYTVYKILCVYVVSVFSVSRYISKIADIFGVAPIYFENRRYIWSCADIFEKSLIYFGGDKMIVKERKLPVYLLQLEALLRRLPAHHPKGMWWLKV